ncbi:protein-L-isoaspartate O-methyltransferase [Salmonella enterica subsp. enterica serovar Heidelberg]|nr:protein-L-isoaspartate O-methyltransferase [Salmonella enterica subsp. enterica serovar Heidelberg]
MFLPVMAMAGKAGRRVRRFDAIIVTAAPPEIPTALMAQLDEGGILVLPVGDEQQFLKRVRRRGGEFIIDTVEAVRFVPLVKGELA